MRKISILPQILAAALVLGAALPAAAATFGGTEEDAAVPHGAFTSNMPVPAVLGGPVSAADIQHARASLEKQSRNENRGTWTAPSDAR